MTPVTCVFSETGGKSISVPEGLVAYGHSRTPSYASQQSKISGRSAVAITPDDGTTASDSSVLQVTAPITPVRLIWATDAASQPDPPSRASAASWNPASSTEREGKGRAGSPPPSQSPNFLQLLLNSPGKTHTHTQDDIIQTVHARLLGSTMPRFEKNEF